MKKFFIYIFLNFSLQRNEREGIRADLLSLVDTTVEIPQAGVIRSLNVHVSGALCISEYARKYLNFMT